MPSDLTRALKLPLRANKPRTKGLTMVIDCGRQSTQEFAALIGDYAGYIDIVKFGFGIAAVTPDAVLQQKIDHLKKSKIPYYFGGTLTEIHILQKKFRQFMNLCRKYECTFIEISNGTLETSSLEKAAYISEAVKYGLRVISEVGYKGRSKKLSPKDWVHAIKRDLKAGAEYVITEARESGTSGLADPQGHIRAEILKAIIESGLPLDKIIFEAPTKELQVSLIERLGPDVNLGNIGVETVAALETLRLGLRSDTMMHFHDLGSKK